MSNSANFFKLVAEFQRNIDWLNTVLLGDENTSVIVDGVEKPSVTKDLSDKFNVLDSYIKEHWVQLDTDIQKKWNDLNADIDNKWSAISAITHGGRIVKETKAELISSGQPSADVFLAEVWKDEIADNNGLYGWNGSSWEKSVYDYPEAISYARYELNGSIKSIDPTEVKEEYKISFDRLYLKTGRSTIRIAPVDGLLVPNLSAVFVDLNESPVDGVYIPRIGPSTNDYSTGRQFVIFSNDHGIFGGKAFRGYDTLQMQSIDNRIIDADAIAETGRYLLLGGMRYQGIKDNSTSTAVISFDELQLFKGSYGGSLYRVRSQSNVEIAQGQALYVDTTIQDEGGWLSPMIAPAYASEDQNGRGAFSRDGKVILFANYINVNGTYGGLLTQQPFKDFGSWAGHVVMPGANVSISYDEQTRVLSWDGDIYFQFDRAKRLRLNAGSVHFASGNQILQVAYIDLSKANYDNADPALCVKVGQYFQGVDRYYGTQQQLPFFYCSAGQYDTIGGFPKPMVEKPSIGFDPDQIVVKIEQEDSGGTQVVFVYWKGTKEKSNNWIKWRLERRPLSSVNSDTWHSNRAWEVLIDDAGNEKSIREVITGGENETAIREVGKADFMGGTAHGDEMAQWAYATIDGLDIDLTVTGTYFGRELTLSQMSFLYEEGTEMATKFSENYKHWMIRRGEVEVTQKNKLLKDTQLNAWYNTFLCVARNQDADKNATLNYNGSQWPQWELLDLKREDHNLYNSTEPHWAKTWGDGVVCEAEILEGWDQPYPQPLRDMFFQKGASYNKMYFNLGFETLRAGDIVNTRYIYRVQTGN